MRTTIAVLLVICFCRCSFQNTESSVTEDIDFSESMSSIMTDFEFFYPPTPISEGFALDTFIQFDPSKNLDIFIFMPVSDMEEVNNVVKAGIESQKNEFIENYLGEENDFRNYFYAVPISIYKDEKIISLLFVISYYSAGAAHPMTVYHSFNFDAKTKQQIDFNDYFLVKSKADTTFFTEIITRAINQEGVFLHELYNLSFNIEKDTISFDFSTYEIASYVDGLIQGRIHKKELYDKIKTKYQ